MALTEKRTSKNQQDLTIGPVMASQGGDPPNPAETLRTGALPRRMFNQTTGAYALQRPVSLHRGEDARKQTDWNKPDEGSPEDYCEPRPDYGQPLTAQDPGEGKFGTDKNKYSKGPNVEVTPNGARIYGT